MRLTNITNAFKLANLTFGFMDHFIFHVDGQLWTKVGNGTPAIEASASNFGGRLNIPSGSTANNETYVGTTNEPYQLLLDKPILAEFNMGFVEADTDNAAVCMGLVDQVGANLLTDTTGVPKSPATGFMIYKRPGETLWRAWASVGSVQFDELLSSSNRNNLSKINQPAGTVGPVMKTFQLEFQPLTSGYGYFNFFIDNIHVAMYKNVSLAGALPMAAVMGSKTASANDQPTRWDWAGAEQTAA